MEYENKRCEYTGIDRRPLILASNGISRLLLRNSSKMRRLMRVDLENRIQSLKEELTFLSQVHRQELNELVSRTWTAVCMMSIKTNSVKL